jgi:hypothetical protein
MTITARTMKRRTSTLVAPVLLAVVTLAGCGGEGDGITLSTTCRDYLKYDQETRAAAIRTLGTENGWAGASHPFAVLNVDSYCGQALDEPLRAYIERAAKNG